MLMGVSSYLGRCGLMPMRFHVRGEIGEWVCVDARTLLAPNGCGLAESQLFDEIGLIGRATQSLAVRARN